MKAVMSLKDGRFIILNDIEFKVTKEVMLNLIKLKAIEEIKYEFAHNK